MASIPAAPVQQHKTQTQMTLPLQSRKRTRADTSYSNMPPPMSSPRSPCFYPAAPEYDLRTALESIPKNLLVDNLLRLNVSNPSIATWARSYHHFLAQKEQKKIIRFEHYADSLWKEMNLRHDKGGGSKQFELAGEVMGKVVDSVRTIGDEVQTISSWETKRSAMETLRKITMVILDSSGVIADEIRKDFRYDSSVNDAFLKVMGTMDTEERARMCQVDDGTGPFSERLVDTVRICNAEDWNICAGLDDVVDLLLESVDDDPDFEDEDDDES
ncbi:hypothetical protein E2P81_ATG06341 [Venturia nashicola]|uniref:Uncharacterized protein n=1 Tax=Venturia nashicola TaxID=86259 RepID=A0A4Z1PBQ9_9PEZI|nr:hypothetical protein E6O75_ATG06494 [Venturia nashicola]TLD27995.1 hypothetical protein E2P81_ATG06341 [Venturia nashicola]